MHLLNWASPTPGASEVGLPHVTRALGLFFLLLLCCLFFPEKRVARAAFDLGQWLQARPQPLHAAPQASKRRNYSVPQQRERRAGL